MAVVKIVPHWELRLARLGCVSFSRSRIIGETRCKKYLDRFEMYGYPAYAASSNYPGKERTIASKNYKSNILIREVPTPRNEDKSHEETERQQRCARSKAWNLAKKKHFQAQKKTKLQFYFPAEDWVLPAAST